MDAMHKFFLVARRYKLCGAHIIDLDDLSRAPANPQVLLILKLLHMFSSANLALFRFLT